VRCVARRQIFGAALQRLYLPLLPRLASAHALPGCLLHAALPGVWRSARCRVRAAHVEDAPSLHSSTASLPFLLQAASLTTCRLLEVPAAHISCTHCCLLSLLTCGSHYRHGGAIHLPSGMAHARAAASGGGGAALTFLWPVPASLATFRLYAASWRQH